MLLKRGWTEGWPGSLRNPVGGSFISVKARAGFLQARVCAFIPGHQGFCQSPHLGFPHDWENEHSFGVNLVMVKFSCCLFVWTQGKGALPVWFTEAASACLLVVSGDLAVKLVLDKGSPPGPLPPPCSSRDPQHVVFPLHSESHSKSKCCFFLFETQKCKIAEISNISRSAPIRPLCTKDQMINVHTYKNTVCITYVQYMCKMYGIQTWYGIDFRGANSKYKGIMVFLLKNNIKAIHEWTPDCHHFLFIKLLLW